MITRHGSFTIRPARPDDTEFLWLMVTYAGFVSPPGPESIREAKADEYLRLYVDGWVEDGDLALIGEDPDGRPIGAAWLRRQHGHGRYLLGDDPDVPKAIIAVLPEALGSGAGALLLMELMRGARERYRAVIGSCRDSNPMSRFYRRLGFRPLYARTNRSGTRSTVLRCDFSAG